MNNNKRTVRPKTSLEKEWENLPACLYDTVKGFGTCPSDVFPPERKICRECLLHAILYGIDNAETAYAWDSVLRLVNFYEKKDSSPKC